MSNSEIVASFRAKVIEIKQKRVDTQFSILPHHGDVKQGNRFVAVIDSISSMPGIYMPWKELVAICKEEGLWSIIDAAHSIGQEVSVPSNPPSAVS